MDWVSWNRPEEAVEDMFPEEAVEDMFRFRACGSEKQSQDLQRRFSFAGCVSGRFGAD